MIEIEKISLEKIQAGEFENELPEFYDLKNVFENNLWHHETTFEHTLSVLSHYNAFLDDYCPDYLNDKLEKNSKKELLKIAILLHDISKKETIVTNEEGKTSFPGHDIKGGIKARGILDRFNITDKEKEYIVSIITNHDKPHVILDSRKNCSQKLKELENDMKDIYKETLILALVDTMGSKLKENDEEEYNFRINKFKDALGVK